LAVKARINLSRWMALMLASTGAGKPSGFRAGCAPLAEDVAMLNVVWDAWTGSS